MPKVDLGKKAAAKNSPFEQAAGKEPRIKAAFFGPAGSGKTLTALNFPAPCVLDAEGGTNAYGNRLKFDVRKATNADEIRDTVNWLGANPHPYQTLIIDPITVYWESLLAKWTEILRQRNQGSKGFKFDYYDLQPKDWAHPKGELKEFFRRLILLDMNIILIAREKPVYSDKAGDFMVKVGETFDAERSLDYHMDLVLRFSAAKGVHSVQCRKDRWGALMVGETLTLPEDSYPFFSSRYGGKKLSRKAEVEDRADEAHTLEAETLATTLDLDAAEFSLMVERAGASSLDMLSANACDDLIATLKGRIKESDEQDARHKTAVKAVRELIKACGLSKEQVAKSLSKYDVTKLADLSPPQLAVIEKTLAAKLEK